MKKYFLVIALCAVQIVHTAHAEKYTVRDLYELYNQADSDTIITSEIRANLPYYKKIMSEHINGMSCDIEQQDLMIVQEKVKSAAALAATLNVFLPGAWNTLEAFYSVEDDIINPYCIKIRCIGRNMRLLILSGMVLPFAVGYFKNTCTYKKKLIQRYEVGKKILAQLEEEYECSISL